MSCCNKKHHHHHLPHVPDKFIDLSKADAKEWEEVPALVSIDDCGKLTSVQKPEYDDKIIIDGDGNSALYNDGQYKTTYTKDQADAAIQTALEDAVMYEADNTINPRSNIIFDSGDGIEVKRANSNKYDALKLSGNVLNVGDAENQTNIKSLSRPTVNTSNQIAYVSDVDALQDEINEIIDSGITGIVERVDELEERVDTNTQSISDLQTTTEDGFNTVNNSLSALDDRVTTNEINISTNAQEIEDLRNDFINDEKFKGYFADYNELIEQVPNPTPGDYAYLASTGTKWAYNGTAWYDTTVPVPDQTVDAYDGLPLMDGVADAGTSNRYSRGNHRHPSDTTKANVTDLNDYFPLAGNTQTNRVSGDMWMNTGQKIRLTNSGNSYLGNNTDTNVLEIIGNGVGGIDLIANNGTVKADGKEVVSYESNDEIIAKGNIRLKNNGELYGLDGNGVGHNLAMVSRFNIADYGSATLPMNFTANSRPTVQLPGETGAQAHEVAFLGDVQEAYSELNEMIQDNASAISDNAIAIGVNASDIAAIQADLANTDHFRGYYATTAQVTAIPNPSLGDFAYNAQTGTKWAYNGATWYDTLDEIPDQTVDAYDGLPLIDGTASSGLVNQYSRGDHRHPTDTTRASASALTQTNLNVSDLRSDFDSYVSNHADEVDQINTAVVNNTGSISNLENRVSGTESNINGLQTQAAELIGITSQHSGDIADLQGRVGINESDIESLRQQVNENENFKGYFLQTTQITAIAGTQGDFAWNGETGTVWIYNGTLLTWQDSLEPIPTGAVNPSDALPLIDDEADAGSSTEYARGDHRHPTDITRAAASDLLNYYNKSESDANYVGLTGAQSINGPKAFNSTITAASIARGNAGSYIGTSGARFNAIYIENGNFSTSIVKNGVEVATVNDINNLPKHITLAQAEYDALTTKDPNTYYYTLE